MIGLTSFGAHILQRPDDTRSGAWNNAFCAPNGAPTVFARVTAVMDWIKMKTRGSDVYDSNCRKIWYILYLVFVCIIFCKADIPSPIDR